VLRGLCEWSVSDPVDLLLPTNLEGAFIRHTTSATKQLHLSTCMGDELQASLSPASYAHLIRMCTGARVCVLC